jgi:sortase A
MARLLRILSLALATAGLVVLADAAVTIAWKEPLSAVYGQIQQDRAATQLDDLEVSFAAEPATEKLNAIADPTVRARRLADRFARRLKTGKPIARILMPAAKADYVVLEGTDTETLTKGPGHYPTTALPGQGRTVAIAGHRTTYGAPFRRIDNLDPGDPITVRMPYATFRYEVEKEKVVSPTDVQIVDDIGRDRLVLTACHPLYSAAQRYVIFARLTDLTLAGAAQRPAPGA